MLQLLLCQRWARIAADLEATKTLLDRLGRSEAYGKAPPNRPLIVLRREQIGQQAGGGGTALPPLGDQRRAQTLSCTAHSKIILIQIDRFPEVCVSSGGGRVAA